MTKKETETIDVTPEEKELFSLWLIDRQRELLVQLDTVKSLLNKVSGGEKPYRLVRDRINVSNETRLIGSPKWAEKSLSILKQKKRRMDSTEIVEILMETDAYSASLPRVEVMRGVSSRLNQLVNRKQAKKEEIDGKMYYTYLKD